MGWWWLGLGLGGGWLPAYSVCLMLQPSVAKGRRQLPGVGGCCTCSSATEPNFVTDFGVKFRNEFSKQQQQQQQQE